MNASRADVANAGAVEPWLLSPITQLWATLRTTKSAPTLLKMTSLKPASWTSQRA